MNYSRQRNLILDIIKNTSSHPTAEWVYQEAKFVLAEGEEVVAAYEYCNLHGFWKGTAV